MSRQHGNWHNLSETQSGSTSLRWPPTAAVSTCAVVISSEQSGQFHSVRGTDKIVLSEAGRVTTSLQTAPARSERDQASDQPNKSRIENPSKR